MQYHFISFIEHINPSTVKELTLRFAMNSAGKDHVELLECTLQLRSFKRAKRVPEYQCKLTNEHAFIRQAVANKRSLPGRSRALLFVPSRKLHAAGCYRGIVRSYILQRESQASSRTYTRATPRMYAYSHANPAWYDDLESC